MWLTWSHAAVTRNDKKQGQLLQQPAPLLSGFVLWSSLILTHVSSVALRRGSTAAALTKGKEAGWDQKHQQPRKAGNVLHHKRRERRRTATTRNVFQENVTLSTRCLELRGRRGSINEGQEAS